MTDASTVGRFWDCVTLVLWLPDEMVCWILRWGDVQSNICTAVV